jgi:Protein of unknown function (DUF4058)
MPSPFPGMNPYLEQASVWKGFHNRFVTIAADILTAQVDPAYFVEIDEHIYLHEWPVAIGRGDVTVAEGLGDFPADDSSGMAIATATTSRAVVSYPTAEEVRSSFLELRDRESHRIVTVLELLSRSNKYSGPDREQYLMKRQTLLLSDVNFVEIDLMRGGPRMPNRNVSECDYSVLVSRPGARPFADFWAIGLRDRLPKIPIPLRTGDKDVAVDLQAVLHRVYDSARYGSRIYSGQPEPALSAEDSAWAQQLVPPQA